MIPSEYGGLYRLLKGLLTFVFLCGPTYADDVTILALGDSLTAGYGLPQGDGFTPQLEAWLNDQGVDATVINGGVSGDTTAGGAARLGWVLNDDIDAVIVALGGNDMLRGIDPQTTHDNLDHILTQLTARGLPTLLVGIPGPANFGTAYKDAFNQAFTTLSATHKVPLYENFLAGLEAASASQSDALRYLQNDGLHPTKEGVGLIVAAIGPAVVQMLP